jgi:hypothetical protein
MSETPIEASVEEATGVVPTAEADAQAAEAAAKAAEEAAKVAEAKAAAEAAAATVEPVVETGPAGDWVSQHGAQPLQTEEFNRYVVTKAELPDPEAQRAFGIDPEAWLAKQNFVVVEDEAAKKAYLGLA